MMCIVIILMKRLKQIVLFLLVVVSIYSTMLFYLLMSVHADSRLQEIDYIEKTRPEVHNKVLHINRILPVSQRLHHFSISKVSYKDPKQSECSFGTQRQAVLLISASSFDTITIYSKILRQIQSDQSCMPKVYVLKRLHPLILNNEQNINKYALEIGEALKYLTIEEQFQVSIFTHEEGALLTLAYLARKTINYLYFNIIQKLKTVLFVDITHPFLRVEYDPPYKLLQVIKMEIMAHKQRIRVFNKLKFVIVTTHKEDILSEHFFFQLGEEKYTFAKTLLISSRQMANVHYFLPPNSLSFPPLVRRLAHFLSKDFAVNLTIEEANSFLKYGQSYAHQKRKQESFPSCSPVSMAKNDLLQLYGTCVKLTPFKLQDEEALVLYSANHFQVYSNDYNRMYPFDNLTQGSIYVFQRLAYPLYILNQQKSKVYVRRQKIASPISPLQMQQQDVFYTSQMLFTNYSVVRICPNVLLTFPLHFAQGNIHRKFLGQGEEKCFTQSSLFQNFSWQLFLNWSLFRNMVIFTLICSFIRKQPVSERLLEQFSINMVILMSKDCIESKVTLGIYIVAFSVLVQYLNSVIIHLISYFTLKQNWASFLLLAISIGCMLVSFFNLFNYWKIFGVAVVFFINKQNLPIFLMKIYFIKEEFPFNSSGYSGITDLGLMTMWLYTTLVSHEQKLVPLEETYWTAEHIFTSMLLMCLAVGIDWPGGNIETMITVYMKLLIVLRMLRIFRK